MSRPNPSLWARYSKHQVYVTALTRFAPSNGPALTITALIPDLDHYCGRGGRVLPLWADATATQPNVRSELLEILTEKFGLKVSCEDIIAYIATVAAHPGYVERFAAALVQPGLRLPITFDPALFTEAVKLGREVVWLHTFGERYVSAADGRPANAPRMPEASRPQVPEGGAIPSSPDAMPDAISFDAAAGRIHVGTGYIDGVSQEVWDYEVSGKHVLTQWFSYRGRDRTRPMIGDRRPPSPLGDIQPEGWPAEYTTELLNVLNVLGRLVLLEPVQTDLLARIYAGPTLDCTMLAAALTATPRTKGGSGRRNERQGELLG